MSRSNLIALSLAMLLNFSPCLAQDSPAPAQPPAPLETAPNPTPPTPAPAPAAIEQPAPQPEAAAAAAAAPAERPGVEAAPGPVHAPAVEQAAEAANPESPPPAPGDLVEAEPVAPAVLPDPLAMPAAAAATLPRSAFAPDAIESAAGLEAFVDGLVEAQRREHGIPALGLALVRRDQPDLLRGYGQDDIEGGRATDPANTLFRIGSVSKTFIWTSVLILVDRGLLDLDADVNTYLKAVKLEAGFGAPVTMRHLMSHRAGFEDSLRVFSVADDDARPLAQLLAAHQPKRVYAPGARTSYSNWGSALAAQVVEDVSGQAFGEFLRSEVLDPLGMRQTTTVAPSQFSATASARLAKGYADAGGGVQTKPMMQLGAYWPAGGIASTPAEMARWMRFHLGGGEFEGRRLLSAERHALLFTRPFDDRPGAADLTHGLIHKHYRGLQVFGHGGATARFLSNMVLVPELGLGLFLSQNINGSRSTIANVPELILDRVHGAKTLVALVPEPAEAGGLAAANGDYVNNRRVFTSFAAVFASLGRTQLQALSPELLRHQNDRGATLYRRIGEDLFEAVNGQRLALLRDATGGVAAFSDDSGVHSYERAGLLNRPLFLQIGCALALLLALTTCLGAILRSGRVRSGGLLDRVLGGFSLLSALIVFGGATTAVLLSMALGEPSALTNNYPLPQMLWVHWAGWAIVGAAAAMLLGMVPAWTSSQFGFFRRLHFSLFALALGFLAVQLYLWRVVGAPVY